MKINYTTTLILLAITLLIPASLAAATIDTVKVFNQPERVVIAEDSVGVMMNVTGTSDDGQRYDYVYRNDHRSNERVVTTQTGGSDIQFRLPFQKEDTTVYSDGTDNYRRHIQLLIGGLYFGWGWLNVNSKYPAMDEYNRGLAEWGLMHVLAVRFQPLRRHYLTMGFGFEGRTIKMRGQQRLEADDQHRVTVTPFGDDAISGRSMLHISTLQVPVTYSVPIIPDLRFIAGPVIDFNLSSKITNSYKTIDSNGHKQTITDEYGKLGIHRVTIDLIGAITYDGIGAYLRYRPMPVFKSNHGPKFNTWSAGLIISF